MIVTPFQDFKLREKQISPVIFLLWANQFAKKWYNCGL